MTEATTLLAAAAVQGVLNGSGGKAGAEEGGASRAPERQILDRIMDALTSERGTSLVTLAVSMACRSSVQAMYEFGGSSDAEQPSWLEILLSFGTSPSGERLYSTCVGAFVREGMKVSMLTFVFIYLLGASFACNFSMHGRKLGPSSFSANPHC